MDYHVRYWKSELIDFVLLQQDAFDKIDCSTPLIRQQYMLNKLMDICSRNPQFDNFEQCAAFYKDIINVCRQMNYSEFESPDFKKHESTLESLIQNS